MRTVGLIGGMSWESTLPYYRLVNERIRDRLGGLHSSKLLLYSVDFAELEAMQRVGDWEAADALMTAAARALQAGGAQALAICANTMHRSVPAIEAVVDLPVLHIADATAQAVRDAGLSRIALLGTRFTMEQPFYRERLEHGGLRVVVPDAAQRDDVHRVIYDELCRGRIVDASRDRYRAIMAALVDAGAEGIVLGCTEIGLLVDNADATVPLFDTTAIHARAIADWQLG
ncbi:aspartate/glutamate racemase family protein [Cognatilysobacter lacus]|uniref:Aspartate/glutamate racemase family protein n=1 Tax=Cognatilysobacter lacus TaxID=1643323 RepID=A0A5D8Z6X9_9GAMM|nr:aspartate/glutamate racemase family protein [Lysobacter lacus]TZF90427.1 aspartate/glutamate racemase family protein [Lysobacter lacus]